MNIYRYLKQYTKESVLGPLFKLFEATLELIVPLVVASIIDKGIATGDGGHIARMCLLLVALGVIGLLFSVTAQYFAATAAVGFSSKLRGELFRHVQRLSYSDVDRLGTSSLITVMTSDTAKVQTGLNQVLRLMLRSPFVVFGAMIMAFTVDVRSGYTFAAVIPVLSLIVFGIMCITTPMYKKVQKSVDRIVKRTRENLSGARVIRAFAKEDSEQSLFNAENESLTGSQKRVGHISALLNPLTYVVINLGILLLIYTGALQVDSGDLTRGELIALYNYMSQILVELIKLANLIVHTTKALASASRISDMLAITPSQSYGTREHGEGSEVMLEMSGVSLRYSEGADNALSDISFKAMRGETVGIIGGTGSGKSSLINLIARFYDATEGTVTVDGVPAAEYTREGLLSKIGIVPQRAVLFKGSIRENMLWGNVSASDEEIYEALRTAQAEELVRDKGGLDAAVEAQGRNFSGGQKQRLTIARALVRRPEILILDDSSSALDYATDARLRAAISNIRGTSTVFIVSQRASSVMHADKIIVLDDGRAVGIGTHKELMQSCREYVEIYESQFEKGDCV